MRAKLRAAAGLVATLAASGVLAAQGARPLPDADEFFERVRQNLSRAEREDFRYAFTEQRTDIHRNPFGRLGTGGTRLFEVYPSATRRLTYRRLVARDGVPVPASELAEQDREYRERAADVRRELATRSEDERRRLEADAEERRRRAQERVEDVIGTLAFTLKGRTTYRGTEAIVIAFTPKPDADPRTREGRIAGKFAGTIWVDEAAAEVMRVEAEAIDSISFGFGIIARLGEGATVTLTRRPVEDGLWLPTELTLSGRGRAVLFRRLDLDFRVEWSDYRRQEGGSLTPFLDSRVEGQPGGRPQ